MKATTLLLLLLPVLSVAQTEPLTWTAGSVQWVSGSDKVITYTDVVAEMYDTLLTRVVDRLTYVPGAMRPEGIQSWTSSGYWEVRPDTFSVEAVAVRLFVEDVLPMVGEFDPPRTVRLYLTPEPILVVRPGQEQTKRH